MTLQMNYQEKYDTGYDTGYSEGDRKRAISVASKMIESNKLSSEEIALYSCLTLEQVHELEKDV